MMRDPTWDALFVATYQSTDKMDDTEGIGPEMDIKEVTMSIPSQLWVMCPPTYCAAVVSL